MELTDCWHLHSQCPWIKCSWQGLLFYFSGEIWWIMKQSQSRVSCCARITRGTCANPCALLVVTHSLCHPLRSSVFTVKPRHHKGAGSGDQRLWLDSLKQYFFFIHAGQCLFILMKPKKKKKETWPLGCLPQFLSFIFSVFFTASVKSSLQWCPYGGMIF